MTKFTEKTDRIFNRALEIIKHTEIPNQYFLVHKGKIPPHDMFSLIGLLSETYRNIRGEFLECQDLFDVSKEYIEKHCKISDSDIILTAKDTNESLFFYMLKVVGNIESGHLKARFLSK